MAWLSVAVLLVAIGVASQLVKAKPQPKTSSKSHNVTFVKTQQVTFGRKPNRDELSWSSNCL